MSEQKKECVNRPGSTDHDTASCPLMSNGNVRNENIIGMRKKIKAQAEHIERLEFRIAEQRKVLRGEQVEGAQGEREEDGDTIINQLRLGGLSIDGDNAYKRDLLDCVIGALAFGFQGRPAPEESHWLHRFWEIGNAEREARAALAQPSRAQTYSLQEVRSGTGWPAGARFSLAQPSPAPELERPEVVAFLMKPDMYEPYVSLRRDSSCQGMIEPLMTVAQHDRISEHWRQKFFAELDNSAQMGAALACALQERDAAQARVAELESATGYAEARQCATCRHIGINDSSGTAVCHDCDWRGHEPSEDKCPGCGSVNCMAAACPECGGRYELVAEARLAAPVAQAGQVPDIAAPLSECMALAQTVFARLEGMMPQGKKLPENHVARRLLAELEKLQQLAAAPAQGGRDE